MSTSADLNLNPSMKMNSWRRLRFAATTYLWNEASVEQKIATIPAADRVKLLRQLGNALGEALCKVDEAIQTDARDHWFLAWCEATGTPVLTDPIIVHFDAEFYKAIASLAALKTAACLAAKQGRQRRGRPGGTAVLPHDCILALESIYRDITKGKSGAGPGPFARFVKDFLTALGRESTQQYVIEIIKDAKKREEKHPATSRWGRSLFDSVGRDNPPSSV